MIGFDLRITDLWGEEKTRLSQYGDVQVECPLNDSRLASFQLSIHDAACAHIAPLTRCLKVLYNGNLVFWGPITLPQWDASQGLVTVQCHDMTLRLKRHYLRYGDAVIAGLYPLDGIGAWTIHEAANPTGAQLAAGVPPLGIVDGNDWVPPTATLFRQEERGSNVWDVLMRIAAATEGFDMEWVPVDERNPPTNEPWASGIMAEFNRAVRLGQDRSATVKFYYGTGADNLDQFTYSPDGMAVRNRATFVTPGGTADETDAEHSAHAKADASFVENGIYEAFEASGDFGEGVSDADVQAALQSIADHYVGAYGRPTPQFTLEPAIEKPGELVGAASPFRFLEHFWVGDTIRAVCRKGYLQQDVIGRVMKVTLRQHDQNGAVRTAIDVVPHVVDEAEIGSE